MEDCQSGVRQLYHWTFKFNSKSLALIALALGTFNDFFKVLNGIGPYYNRLYNWTFIFNSKSSALIALALLGPSLKEAIWKKISLRLDFFQTTLTLPPEFLERFEKLFLKPYFI